MEQARGIKGKIIAKKNYAEKALMKKTWVLFLGLIELSFVVYVFLVLLCGLFS